MKTLNSIKNFSLSLIILFGFIANANSMKVQINEIIQVTQTNKVWVTISNSAHIPYYNETSELVSMDEELNTALKTLHITNVQRAVSESRSEKLIKVYEFTAQFNKEDLIRELSKIQALSMVESAPEYRKLATPNDYNHTTSDYSLDLINAQGAWDYSIGDSSVTIAISDQNVDVNHPELLDQVVYYDVSNNTSTSHGTAVALIAGGSTNNSLLHSHIGYNSSLAIYQMNYNEVIAASYAGHRVINLSWTSGCEYSQYVQDIVDEVYENGTFIVAAAGNGSTCGGSESLVYPASCDHVFSVTSIGPNDNHERIEGNSSSTHQHNEMVDLSAPGYDLTISPATNWNVVGSGTSYAAPFVSGTVGLILDVNPCLSNDDIEYILKTSSENIDVENPNYVGMIGTGRLDAAAALELASSFTVFEIETEVIVSCNQVGGNVDVAIIGGNAPYTALWSDGSENLNLVNVPSGSYSLMVTDALGCTSDVSVDIETMIPVTLADEIQNVSCNGSATGAIDVTVVQGTPDYTYQWLHGPTSEDISELYAGTYRLTVTDGNGCQTFVSYEVLEPESIDAELIVDEPSFQDDLSTVDLTVVGGMAPYTFEWNTGDASEDLYNVSEGYYEVVIIDANQCIEELNVTVEGLSQAGLNESEAHDVNVYPNPTANVATVSWTNKKLDQLSIINANGQLVEKMDVAMVNEYRTNELNPGIYFINLSENQSTVATRKLVVR
jgi:subtilisin family serine protease